ncbi:MAG: alpha/beta hydrolase [Ignavibacteriales bacterium]|nr:alpha/beta hydrolase [Ignavibacteriales bacterium]
MIGVRARSMLIVLVLLPGIPSSAQLAKNSRWTGGLREQYVVTQNIIYSYVDTMSDRLDLYVPKELKNPAPVLMWIHGGGWGRLSKDSVSGQIIPYLELGWIVANVNYRLTAAALAPAAVQDCRAILRWIAANARRLNADLQRIVLSGSSAGGHLALITGMLPSGIAFDTLGVVKETPHVAAIINHYGITDVNDLLGGANRKGYAVAWIGEQPNKHEVAKAVSPLTYIRKDLPPIFSVQGNADPTVPYSHSIRLHAALDSVGVPNELMTILGGQHGKFSKEENENIRLRVAAFLKKYKIMKEQE